MKVVQHTDDGGVIVINEATADDHANLGDVVLTVSDTSGASASVGLSRLGAVQLFRVAAELAVVAR